MSALFCTTCASTDHSVDEHFEHAFRNPSTGEPYGVPADIREAATFIARAYGIRGISDPMYIANVIAERLGRGDGQSHFFEVAR